MRTYLKIIFALVLSLAVIAGTTTLIVKVAFYFYQPILFQNIDDLQAYAQRHPELPPSDNQNWLDPDYSGFQRQQQPGLFKQILYALRILQKPLWSAEKFKILLQEVTQQRLVHQLSDRSVAQLQCAQDTTLYLWSDVHAAYHSLVRDLVYLEKKGVINKQLKIKDPKHYFIFNGDFIDRSAYVIESLTIMLILFKQNPNNIVYVRGKHEDYSYWKNYGLRRELHIKASHVSDESIPLEKLITTFFNTLPLALYIKTADDTRNLIRISHYNLEYADINENKMGMFFSQSCSTNNLTYYDLTQNKPTTDPVTLQAVVHTEDWMAEHRFGQGLGYLGQEQGITAWTGLSSPIQIHLRYYDFHYDAFAVINVKQPITDSTITLYNRDIYSKEDFAPQKAYNITTALPAGSSQELIEPIKIGSSLSLVSGVPGMGQSIRRGMTLYINKTNQEGGIKGRPIRTIIYNDNYIPFQARRNILKLIQEDDTHTVLAPTGSPTLDAYLDLIKEDKLLVTFPVTGALQFRNPDLSNIIHLRATYSQEIQVLIDYMITQYSARKFAFFYQDDAYGQDALKAAHDALKTHGITESTNISYLRASTDFSYQADQVRKAQPDAIGLLSAADPSIEFIRQIGIENLTNKQLFGISFLGEATIRRYISNHGLNIVFGAIVPNPVTSQLEIVKEYREIMSKHDYSYDVFSLEGYIAANILLDAMQHIQGPINYKTIKKQLESLKDYNFKGLNLTYNAKDHSLARYVWIEDAKNDEWILKDLQQLGKAADDKKSEQKTK